MTPARFLETRGPAWKRLEAIIQRTRTRGVAALSEPELHELTRLYPAVAVDVARARMYKLDQITQDRINRLAIAAHGLLYRRPSPQPVNAVARFFTSDYPRLFRRLLPYVVLATTLFLAAGLGSYVSTRLKPSLAHLYVPFSVEMPRNGSELSEDDIAQRFRSSPHAPMAAGIMVNNISVAFYAFSLGISAGLGTCYVLIFNAMMLGGYAAHFTNYGASYPFWSYILPHGVLEIFAIMVSAGAGLRLGLSLAIPGRLTRRASLQRGAIDAVLLVLGTIPMFCVAGVIEGFVTPSHLPGGAKILLGILVAAMWVAYLLFVGHGKGEVGQRSPTGDQ
jgi:uncharacterized membrane protein SpoIIM required for sporulation